MARPKRVAAEERQTVTVTYRIIPAFMVVTDDPKLSGHAGIGRTAKEAVTSIRSSVRRAYPFAAFDIIEKAEDRQLMLATGWKEPTFD